MEHLTKSQIRDIRILSDFIAVFCAARHDLQDAAVLPAELQATFRKPLRLCHDCQALLNHAVAKAPHLSSFPQAVVQEVSYPLLQHGVPRQNQGNHGLLRAHIDLAREIGLSLALFFPIGTTTIRRLYRPHYKTYNGSIAMIRKIVTIDEQKCNGCGLCVPSCAEGAIAIVDGKARLAADNLCDGLGACLGECPQDAIRIVEREADEFDEHAVENHLATSHQSPSAGTPHRAEAGSSSGSGCPGSRVVDFSAETRTGPSGADDQREPSRLGQWPVQLHLVPVNAPFLQHADLLIAADCVPFAYAGFHRDFLAGKALVIACPKLDDTTAYLKKLTEIFRASTVKSITVVRMEVPCCGGIVQIAKQALAASGKEIPFSEVTVGIEGTVR